VSYLFSDQTTACLGQFIFLEVNFTEALPEKNNGKVKLVVSNLEGQIIAVNQEEVVALVKVVERLVKELEGEWRATLYHDKDAEINKWKLKSLLKKAENELLPPTTTTTSAPTPPPAPTAIPTTPAPTTPTPININSLPNSNPDFSTLPLNSRTFKKDFSLLQDISSSPSMERKKERNDKREKNEKKQKKTTSSGG